MKTYLILFAILASLTGVRCSVVDAGDRDEISRRLDALPPDDIGLFRAWAANGLTRAFFNAKAGNIVVAKVRCAHEADDDEDVENNPAKWEHAGEITVDNIVRCLLTHRLADYGDCLINVTTEVGNAAGYTGDKRGCYYEPSPGYSEEDVKAEILGSNTIPSTSERLALRLTTEQMVDALISSSAPPPLPGWGMGGALRPLLPLLCGLSVGWGCPDSPLYPGNGSDR